MDILPPPFVHYPIALLTLYTILELVSIFKKIASLPYLFYAKAILASAGSLAAFAARLTGERDAQVLTGTMLDGIVSLYEFWSLVATIIFLFVALLYLVEWDKRDNVLKLKGITENKTIISIHKIFYRRGPLAFLALSGFFALLITGILGGPLVHGSGADPLIRLFYTIFLIS